MRRREFLGAAASGAMGAMGAMGAQRRPNVVVILADDLGYGDIGAYNAESRIPTPHVDRMAREGVRFTDAHAPCAVCSPTRYGLLTGRYAWRTELKQRVLWPWDRPLIERNRVTLPGLLKRAGYHTACIGKWHLGWEWATTDGSRVNDLVRIGDEQRAMRDEFAKKVLFSKPVGGGPTTRGFDHYFGDDVPNFPPYAFFENDRLTVQPTATKPEAMFGWPGAMAPGWTLEGVLPEITRRAAGYVRERARKGEPYFLYFALTSPHTPIAPSPEFLGKSGAGRYGDWVNQTDWSVGQVLDAVRNSGQAENTIVIFTSDNGPENLTYPVLREHGHASQGQWRGAKRMLWEGGHRVPFVAWAPGRIEAGRVEDEVICLTDLYRTAAGWAGERIPVEAGEDSYDISAAVFGRKRSGPLREATVHHSMNDEYALRQGEWVWIESAKGGHASAEPAWWRARKGIAEGGPGGGLYWLKEDPLERVDLSEKYPDKVRAMRALLERYKREGRSVKGQGG
jgi:arylsulfatase A-like enzyme